jgi:hypothetical protein
MNSMIIMRIMFSSMEENYWSCKFESCFPSWSFWSSVHFMMCACSCRPDFVHLPAVLLVLCKSCFELLLISLRASQSAGVQPKWPCLVPNQRPWLFWIRAPKIFPAAHFFFSRFWFSSTRHLFTTSTWFCFAPSIWQLVPASAEFVLGKIPPPEFLFPIFFLCRWFLLPPFLCLGPVHSQFSGQGVPARFCFRPGLFFCRFLREVLCRSEFPLLLLCTQEHSSNIVASEQGATECQASSMFVFCALSGICVRMFY